MKLVRAAAPILAALAVATALPAAAETTHDTTVSTHTSMKDGVATKKTKVVTVRKHNTHRARRVLGVKVGTKTRTTKTVKETTTSSDGKMSTSTKTTH